MNRRELLVLLGSAVTAARALRAQQKAMPVIGYLSSTSAGPALAAFRRGLSETGYIDGQNVAIEYLWAEGSYDRLPALAADLVGRKVDVIGGTPGYKRRKPRPRRSRSSSSVAVIRSRPAWSPVSPGRVATSPASASCQPS